MVSVTVDPVVNKAPYKLMGISQGCEFGPHKHFKSSLTATLQFHDHFHPVHKINVVLGIVKY